MNLEEPSAEDNDEFYDARSHSTPSSPVILSHENTFHDYSPDELNRGNSNQENGGRYTQLKNLAGLSGTSLGINNHHTKEGYEGVSVISSLSSISQDHMDSNVQPSRNRSSSDRRESNESATSNVPFADSGNDNTNNPDINLNTMPRNRSIRHSLLVDKNSSTTNNANRISVGNQSQFKSEHERLLFDTLFNNRNSVNKSTKNHNNNNLHEENQYFPERVRVNSTRTSDEKNIFREATRLVQTLKQHDGPIWTMKFSPNGEFLCTGGQDTRIFVWCVISHPNKSDSNGTTGGTGSAGTGIGEDSSSFDSKEFDPFIHHQPSPTITRKKVRRHSTLDYLDAANHSRDFEEEEAARATTNTPSIDISNNSNSNNNNNPNTEEEEEEEEVLPFIASEPYRLFEGHSGDVIEVAWSKSHFILSASTDKSVRLWHVSRNDCLQFFRHTDIVTCVEFHPVHDRFFISGCFDRRLRVWDIIPDGVVREWAQVPETITALSFSPDGATVVAGLIQGQVFFYEYDGMKYLTQMDCKNKAGKYNRGSKVTGMQYLVPKDPAMLTAQDSATRMISTRSDSSSSEDQQHVNAIDNNSNNGKLSPGKPDNKKDKSSSNRRIFSGRTSSVSTNASIPAIDNNNNKNNGGSNDGYELLVTTNDNRVRLCRLQDYSVAIKYLKMKNPTMQIRASFSDDGQFIIAGSERGTVHIWRTYDNASTSKFSLFRPNCKRNRLQETFDNTGNTTIATTVAIFAPSEAVKIFVRAQKKLLQKLTNQPSNTGQQQHSQTDREQVPNIHIHRHLTLNECSSRIIATADCDGYIRIYFRLNKT